MLLTFRRVTSVTFDPSSNTLGERALQTLADSLFERYKQAHEHERWSRAMQPKHRAAIEAIVKHAYDACRQSHDGKPLKITYRKSDSYGQFTSDVLRTALLWAEGERYVRTQSGTLSRTANGQPKRARSTITVAAKLKRLVAEVEG